MRVRGSHNNAGWLIGFAAVAVAGVVGFLLIGPARQPETTPLPVDATWQPAERANDVIALRFPTQGEVSEPLSVTAFALANMQKPQILANASALDLLTVPLVFDQARLSLASLPPYLTAKPNLSEDAVVVIPQPRPEQKAKLFTAGQIASFKERLKLSPDQEEMWPAVEAALRAIAWRGSADRLDRKSATLDPKSLLQITVVLGPFIKQLRSDQKAELRSIAHVMGLEQLASQL